MWLEKVLAWVAACRGPRTVERMRVRRPSQRQQVRPSSSTQNSIDTLSVDGDRKAPPHRGGRDDDRTEHLLQSWRLHAVRPQHADGVRTWTAHTSWRRHPRAQWQTVCRGMWRRVLSATSHARDTLAIVREGSPKSLWWRGFDRVMKSGMKSYDRAQTGESTKLWSRTEDILFPQSFSTCATRLARDSRRLQERTNTINFPDWTERLASTSAFHVACVSVQHFSRLAFSLRRYIAVNRDVSRYKCR